jgi:predicted enzyme related to lactoylglutathione lyase
VTVDSFDVGFVSRDGALVEFYASVLDLEELEPRDFPMGQVRRLACGPGVLKVMVPKEPPEAPAPTTNFWDVSGIRYATLWVDDVAAVARRWRAHGGSILMDPFELRPGTFTALGADPDGNVVEIMHQP